MLVWAWGNNYVSDKQLHVYSEVFSWCTFNTSLKNHIILNIKLPKKFFLCMTKAIQTNKIKCLFEQVQTWWQLSLLFSHCPCMWMSRTTNETDKHYFPHQGTLEGTDREDVFFSVRPFVSSEWSFVFFIPATTANDPDFEGFLYLGSKLLQKGEYKKLLGIGKLLFWIPLQLYYNGLWACLSSLKS